MEILFSACIEIPKKRYSSNVVILKQVAVNDSMNLYLYKIGGLSITSESYIAYQRELCTIKFSDFIVYGSFSNFSLGKGDTIELWSHYKNSIDSTKDSPFYYKRIQMNRGDSMHLNYDSCKKIYLKEACEGKQ